MKNYTTYQLESLLMHEKKPDNVIAFLFGNIIDYHLRNGGNLQTQINLLYTRTLNERRIRKSIKF